jgi:hypothetical protein
MAPETVQAYMRALDRADQALDADLPKYLPLWRQAIPAEFADRNWDFSKFGRGERFVLKPIPHGEFDEIFAQVERWGLDQFAKERRLDKLTYTGA